MNSIYMTSTLIANMKALEKGSNNKPFTAIAETGSLLGNPEFRILAVKFLCLKRERLPQKRFSNFRFVKLQVSKKS